MVEETLKLKLTLLDHVARFEPSDCGIALEFTLRKLNSAAGKHREMDLEKITAGIKEQFRLGYIGIIDGANIYRYGPYEISLRQTPKKTKLVLKFTKYSPSEPNVNDMMDVYSFYSLFGKRLLEITGYCFDDFETRFDTLFDTQRKSHRSRDWDEHMGLCGILAHFREFEEAARENWDKEKEAYYRQKYYEVLGKIHDYDE